MGTKEITVCDNCDSVCEEDDLYTTTDDQELCQDCLEGGGYEACDECGEYSVDTNEIYDSRGNVMKWICPDCIDNANVFKCEECEQYFDKDTEDSYTVHDRNGDEVEVCEDCRDSCYSYCEKCEEYYPSSEMRTINNYSYCESCLEEYFNICNNCGIWTDRDEIHWDTHNDNCYCDGCWDDRNSDDENENWKYGIMEYNYTPRPVFFPQYVYGNLYYGIEVEIDKGGASNSNAKTLMQLGNDTFFCKHDGSINNGFEMVTHPCSIEYHMTQLPWKKVCSVAIGLGYRSHDTSTCGVHVHISREGFGTDLNEQDLNIAKLLLFFENNWSNLVKFSRRNIRQLNDWANRYGKRHDETAMGLLNRAKGSGKYFAVNLRHPHTVEIRIFRGTLKVETLIASIQLMDTIVKICRETKLEDMQDVTFPAVHAKAHELGYSELMNEIVSRGIITVAPIYLPVDVSQQMLEKKDYKLGKTRIKLVDVALCGIDDTFEGTECILLEDQIDGDCYRVSTEEEEPTNFYVRQPNIIMMVQHKIPEAIEPATAC